MNDVASGTYGDRVEPEVSEIVETETLKGTFIVPPKSAAKATGKTPGYRAKASVAKAKAAEEKVRARFELDMALKLAEIQGGTYLEKRKRELFRSLCFGLPFRIPFGGVEERAEEIRRLRKKRALARLLEPISGSAFRFPLQELGLEGKEGVTPWPKDVSWLEEYLLRVGGVIEVAKVPRDGDVLLRRYVRFSGPFARMVLRRMDALRDLLGVPVQKACSFAWRVTENVTWDRYSKSWHSKYGPAKSLSTKLSVGPEIMLPQVLPLGEMIRTGRKDLLVISSWKEPSGVVGGVLLEKGRGKQAMCVRTELAQNKKGKWCLAVAL